MAPLLSTANLALNGVEWQTFRPEMLHVSILVSIAGIVLAIISILLCGKCAEKKEQTENGQLQSARRKSQSDAKPATDSVDNKEESKLKQGEGANSAEGGKSLVSAKSKTNSSLSFEGAGKSMPTLKEFRISNRRSTRLSTSALKKSTLNASSKSQMGKLGKSNKSLRNTSTGSQMGSDKSAQKKSVRAA